ncbi:DUF2399 domain-containing protein [Alkalibacterium sp. f15]|uniref:DUF2399 domain-containing protein n=1 Tax=Alkalibacterium sp. f15 TaxID=3414029 RepID=UPI003BF923D7
MFSREHLLNELQEEFPLVKDWLLYIRDNSEDTQWVQQLIEDSPKTFEQCVLYLSEGIRLLPTRPVRLSVFSQIITLDANAFLPTTSLGKLWLHVLAETKRVHNNQPIELPKTRKEINTLLKDHHLHREDITDSVTVVNLFAEISSGYHPMWEAAVHSQSVMTVPLRECVKLSAVYPAHEQPIVWVVDNAEVFSRIVDRVPALPMICTQEEWSCSAGEIFDRLIANGAELRFVGDLTPKGIVRAEELLLRYPDRTRTWQMDVETYLKAKDDTTDLTEEDYALLDKHHVDYLACLKDEVRDQGHPGYLITVVDELIKQLNHYYRK